MTLPADFASHSFKKGDTAYLHNLWNDLSNEFRKTAPRRSWGAQIAYYRKVEIKSWGKKQGTAVDAETGEALRFNIGTNGQTSIRPAVDFAYLGALVNQHLDRLDSVAYRCPAEAEAAKRIRGGAVRFASLSVLVAEMGA